MNEPTHLEIMSSSEFADEMRAIITKNMAVRQHKYDIEAGHAVADHLMCELLKSLGYGEGVEVFENMKKWYA